MALPIYSTRTQFDPRRIGIPSQWIDASDASTLYTAATGGSLVAADGTVGRAEDKSGNGRHATNSVANNRPLRKVGAIGGLDAMLFSATGQALVSPTFSVPQPVTLVLVASVNTVSGGFQVITDGTPNRISLSNNNGTLVARDANANGTNVDGAWVIGVPLVVSWIVNGSSSRLRVNAVQRATATASAGDHTSTTFGGINSTGSFGLNGYICEFILYPFSLTASQAEYVERGLMAKWRV